MKRVLLFTLAIAAASAFAEDTCLELCSSCMGDAKQEVCAKVETLCKCNAILEGLKQELSKTDSTTTETTTEAEPATETPTVVNFSPATETKTAEEIPAEIPSQEKVAATPEPTVAETAVKEDPPKKKDIFYFGLSTNFELFSDIEMESFRIHETDLGLAGSVGFLSRMYLLYDALSIQTGFNGMFRYAEDVVEEFRLGNRLFQNGVYMEYGTIAVEVPIELRIGMPMKFFRPFVSTSANFRKPIWGWTLFRKIESDEPLFDTETSLFSISDWEFVGFFGIGFEITPHFSLQSEWLIWSARTYSDSGKAYESGSWKVNIDLAI